MRITMMTVLLVVQVLATAVSAQAKDVTAEWRTSLVLLEQTLEDNTIAPVGNGFVVSYDGRDFVVTNRRIAEQRGLIITVGLTSRPGTPLRYLVDEVTRSVGLSWSVAPDADIAVIPLVLPAEARQFADSLNVTPLDIAASKSWDFARVGDDVYVLSFPLFLGAGPHTQPIVRSGTVALKDREGEFLVDATTLPGSSGGPVFLKFYRSDERTGKLATGRASYLLGVAGAYISYAEQAISTQTGRAKTVSEENSGLLIVYSADRVAALLRDYLERFDAEGALHR